MPPRLGLSCICHKDHQERTSLVWLARHSRHRQDRSPLKCIERRTRTAGSWISCLSVESALSAVLFYIAYYGLSGLFENRLCMLIVRSSYMNAVSRCSDIRD